MIKFVIMIALIRQVKQLAAASSLWVQVDAARMVSTRRCVLGGDRDSAGETG